ncbi:TyeA family type III secretion system gatekeeper subunit [Apirhabdus apintestini]|nr:TyeA family type III secretion system gatekeeper subunit [Enterobacteriaceae bacterium CA-0114]
MRQGGVPEGAMALLLASLLGDPRLEQKRRRRLEDALSRLLEDESLAIDVFAWLETGAMMNSASLLPLRQLYQRTRNEDEEQPQGIIEWFEEVREWPDRRLRLKLLIRALALDLRQDADHQPARVVAAINELKRLLLFFSMEEHCASVAFSVDVPAEQMLAAVLMLIEQSWVYPDWVEARMREMGIAGDKVIIYLRRMLELLSLLPALCFQDEEQSVQLMEAFEQLQEQWGKRGQLKSRRPYSYERHGTTNSTPSGALSYSGARASNDGNQPAEYRLFRSSTAYHAVFAAAVRHDYGAGAAR